MEYTLQATRAFGKQVESLSDEAKLQLDKKYDLILRNPFRNKRIYGYPLVLFRIRLEDRRKALRVIYTVEGDRILLLCILERKNDYKELKEYLNRSQQ